MDLLSARVRLPIFAIGTLTSVADEFCVGDFCAAACSPPQLSQPPQAPVAMDAAASR
jgi:hypothetical protein